MFETQTHKRIALHIENKLASGSFTPFQPEIYAARAAQWKGNPKYQSYEDWETVLIAPRSFYARYIDDAKKFGRFIAHEDIANYIPVFGGISVEGDISSRDTKRVGGDTAAFIRAVAFAAEKHRNQRRKDAEASPYINHPIALANVLANEGGIEDPNVLCAAVLHDTIEDTETTAAELESHFGSRITSIVLEVTDDKSLEKHVRKQRQIEYTPHSSPEARLVKLADKICNLRDILASPPADWSAERKQGYFDWAAQVVAGLRGTHQRLEAVFDGLCARRADLG